MFDSNDLGVDLGALGTVPDMVRQVRAMFEGFQALGEVAEAAGSTGSPAATATIAMLGVELAAFIVKTLEALDDDIDNLRDSRNLFDRNEQKLQDRSMRMSGQLDHVQYA